MKKDCITEEFPKKVAELFKLIVPGLGKKKCLFKDGLHNLSMEQIHFLTSATDEAGCFLVMLTHMIQAYPKNSYSMVEDKTFENVKTLEFLLSSVSLEKLGLIEMKYGKNKLFPDQKIHVKMTDKSKIIHEKYGEDAINHLSDI